SSAGAVCTTLNPPGFRCGRQPSVITSIGDASPLREPPALLRTNLMLALAPRHWRCQPIHRPRLTRGFIAARQLGRITPHYRLNRSFTGGQRVRNIRTLAGDPSPCRPKGCDAMSWDFSTDPDFQLQLDWMRGFVRENIWPLESIWRDLG